jgi:soluble lytic murein transglycosylase-like protein
MLGTCLCSGLLSLLFGLSWLYPVPTSALAESVPPGLEDTSPAGPPIEGWITYQLMQYQTGLGMTEVETVARTIESQAQRSGLSRDLILAVMRTESGFFNRARSRVGALGLMQIMPATGEMLARQLGIDWKGPETLFDPVVNVRLGVAYLTQLHARYGSWQRALAAYNWGPGAIDRRLRRGRRLPVQYVARVLAALESPTSP